MDNKKTKQIKRFKLHAWHIVIILIISITISSLIVGFLVQNNPFLNFFDKLFYNLIHYTLPHPKIIDILFYPINYNFVKGLPWNIPTYLYLMNIIFLAYLFIYQRSQFKWGLFCLIAGTTLTLSIAAIDWLLVFRERPFISLPNTVPSSEANIIKLFSSFPSGHARETVLYSALIASFIPQIKWIMYLFAFVVSFSRVYYGFHFPTDVIAGGIIGFVAAKAILIIARELQIIWENRKGAKHGQKPKA